MKEVQLRLGVMIADKPRAGAKMGYICGPMSSHDDLNAPAFARAEAYLRRRGFEVFNPAAKPIENPSKIESLEFRREVFALDTHWICRNADFLALLPGWEKSLGATAEIALARAVGIQVVRLPISFMKQRVP